MRKLLITLLICLVSAPAFSAVENFLFSSGSGWVETDTNNNLTVTSNAITMTTDYIPRSNNDSVCKDFLDNGIGNFSWNFEVTLTKFNSNSDFHTFRLRDNTNANTIFAIEIDNASTTRNIRIEALGSATKNIPLPSTVPWSRYFTVQRYDDIVAVKVWTNAERTGVPTQVNTRLNTSGGLRHMCAFHTTSDGNQDKAEGSVLNYEQGTTPVAPLAGPAIVPVESPYSAEYDYRGGFLDIQSQERRFFQENLDYIDDFVIYDTDANYPTVAVDGYDLSYQAMEPDANTPFTFLIKSNTDDTLFLMYPDRLWFATVSGTFGQAENPYQARTNNGDFETTGSWLPYNTPTLSAQSITGTSIFDGDAQWHLIGDADDGLYQAGLKIDTVQDDCVTDWASSDWTNLLQAIVQAKVVSGTPYMKIIDGNGSTVLLDIPVGTAVGHWQSEMSAEVTTTYAAGCGNGQMILYCKNGPCNVFFDNAFLGEARHRSSFNTTVSASSYGDEFKYYTVFHPWEEQYFEDGKRWWIINPLGNVTFFKAAHNLNYLETKGLRHGSSPCAHYKNRIGSSLGCTAVSANKVPDLQALGLNSLWYFHAQEARSESPHATYSYQKLADMALMTGAPVTATGELNSPSTGYDSQWLDAFDPDFRGLIHDMASVESSGSSAVTSYGFATSADVTFNSPAASYHNYFYPENATMADLNILGWDLTNEATGTSGSGCNIGTKLIGAGVTTTSPDGVFDTLIAMTNLTRVRYGNPATESTFLTNIGFEGSNILTLNSAWNTVTGFLSTDSDADGTPDADEAAITAMNLDLGTTFPTQISVGVNAWNNFYTNAYGYGLTNVDGNCGQLDSGETAAGIAFVDYLLEYYVRQYFKTLYEVVFGPDGYFHQKKLNFGWGINTHHGMVDGLIPEEGGEPYVDVLQWRSGCLAGNGQMFRDLYDPVEQAPSVQTMYYLNTINKPFTSDTMWSTGEADSYLGHQGIVDRVYMPTGSGPGMWHGGWDCDMGIDGSVTSIATTTDVLSKEGHGLVNGNIIGLIATSMPGGLAANTAYFVTNVVTGANVTDSFKLSLTSGGPSVDITSAGSGITWTRFLAVDATTDTFTENVHGITDGKHIEFIGSVLPGGISADTAYYLVSATTNTFKVSATPGGSAVNITSAGTRVGWINDTALLTACSVAANTFIIPDQTTVYWDCTDADLAPTNCTNSGTLNEQFFHIPPPVFGGSFGPKIWIETADNNTLNKNDLITIAGGAKKFTIPALSREAAIVDLSANFNGEPDNYWALANNFDDTVINNLSCEQGTNGRPVDTNLTDSIGECIYTNIAGSSTTSTALLCADTFRHQGGGAPIWSGGNCAFFDFQVGDEYNTDYKAADKNTHFDHYDSEITQEDRARQQTECLKKKFDMMGDDGIRHFVGFGLWGIHSSYGCEDDHYLECRDWGGWTPSANKYDGIEATTLGADGIADTIDDEDRNYGNFTHGLQRFLNSLEIVND